MTRCVGYCENPEQLPAKTTGTRPVKAIATPMVLLNVTQQLRETIGYDGADDLIDHLSAEIGDDFVKPDIACMIELVAPTAVSSGTSMGAH